MRLLPLLVPLALTVPGCVPAGSQTPPPNVVAQAEVRDERELIVLTKPPADTLIQEAEALGYELRAVHPLDELGDMLVVFRIPEGRTIAEAIEETERAVPGVTAGAHHLYRIQSTLPADHDYATALIGWPEGGCKALRRVGLIDAGVAPGHPALSDGRVAQERFVPGEAPPSTSHGTLMAELLVGPGKLRDTTVYSAVVVDPVANGGDAAGVTSILRSINWMRGEGVELVNISLAGPRNKLMNRALGQASEDGMILVAAAGNLGPTAPPQYPAAFPFSLAVTAVDREGAVYRRAVQGDHIDVAAPGVDILISSEGRLRVSSGTSVAAPFVTAVLAADPSLSAEDVGTVRDKLLQRTVDLGQPGPDETYGAGLISAPPDC